MTDIEINEAVAIKLGHELIPHSDTRELKIRKSGESLVGTNKVFFLESIPLYSTSIAAAWEIVTLLERYYECYVDVSANYYAFKIDDAITKRQIAFGESTTAPAAICLAFLKMGLPEQGKTATVNLEP